MNARDLMIHHPVGVLLLVVILAGCRGLPGRSSSEPGLDEEPTPTPIPTAITIGKPTYTVQRGDVTKQLIFGGRIVPVTEVDLFFRTSGRVRSVAVRTGESVKSGQVLAELEMANLERDLTGAELALERTQARLQAAEAARGLNRQRGQADLDIAKENLAIVQAQDPAPRLKAAQVALERANLARKKAQATFDSIPASEGRESSPEAAALQQAALDYRAAHAAYELAQQEVAVHEHKIAIAQRQVDLAQIGFDAVQGEVDPLLRNDVKQAELGVEELKASVRDGQIIAPMDGQAQMAFILAPGTFIDAFTYVASVADLADLEVRADTTGVDLSEVSVGMPVRVTLLGRPGIELGCTVRQLPAVGVLARTDRDKELRITCDQSGKDAGLTSGDLIRATMLIEQKQNVLWLPPAAIRSYEGRKFVVVQDATGQRRVDVDLGIQNATRVQIASGLIEGQTVVGQ